VGLGTLGLEASVVRSGHKVTGVVREISKGLLAAKGLGVSRPTASERGAGGGGRVVCAAVCALPCVRS
jgi:hypothetical protein